MVETRSKWKDDPKDTKESGDNKRPKLVMVTPRDRPKIAVRRPPKAMVVTAAPLPSAVEEDTTVRELEKTMTETATENMEETMSPINVLVNAAATIEENLAAEEEEELEPDGANEEEGN